MFTDMVGYTALGQKNEALSLALVEEQMKLMRPILHRHNGREVKSMGDALLVEFSSALDAVRCAYDIQRATREFNISLPNDQKLHLRIGVHVGDVVESQGDISGDAVNVASRIEPLAEDGGVCLTRQVYDHVQNKFELPLASLGPKDLKNVGVPVEVYKMVMPWGGGTDAPSIRFDKKRIAVLPFQNISPDPNDEYFADGLSEEIISSLSQLPELHVIARTSVMQYREKTKPIREIGRELGAGTILEGSVRKAGKKIRTTAQLIDVASETHVWSNSYDRELDDIFAIQSDIAKQVAQALEVRLLAVEKKKLERMPTSNLDAYTLYLKAKFYSDRRSQEGFRMSIEFCEQAIASDPGFALAYSELAWSYTSLGFFGMLPSKEAGVKARRYVEKALRLDDSLAEAHLVIGRILRNYDWDFAAATREYDRAIELNPSLAEAYGTKAVLTMFSRDFKEAIAEVRRALELDPASGETSQFAGTVFLYSGHYDEAIEQFTKALRIDPDAEFAQGNLGLAYVQKEMYEIGIHEIQKGASMRNPSSQSDLAYAFAKAGRFDELERLLTELLKESEGNPEVAVAVASAYANLGDRGNAFLWLERAYEAHLPYLVSANADFVFDSIRSDPRFQALMTKIGYAKD